MNAMRIETNARPADRQAKIEIPSGGENPLKLPARLDRAQWIKRVTVAAKPDMFSHVQT